MFTWFLSSTVIVDYQGVGTSGTRQSRNNSTGKAAKVIWLKADSQVAESSMAEVRKKKASKHGKAQDEPRLVSKRRSMFIFSFYCFFFFALFRNFCTCSDTRAVPDVTELTIDNANKAFTVGGTAVTWLRNSLLYRRNREHRSLKYLTTNYEFLRILNE